MSKIKKMIFNKTPLLAISALILGTVFAFGLQIILAQWQGPTETPPGGGPKYQFINSGPSPQVIQGSLNIGDADNPDSSLNVAGDIFARNINASENLSGNLDLTNKDIQVKNLTVSESITAVGKLISKGGTTIEKSLNITADRGSVFAPDIFLTNPVVGEPYDPIHKTGGKWASEIGNVKFHTTGLDDTGCTDDDPATTCDVDCINVDPNTDCADGYSRVTTGKCCKIYIAKTEVEVSEAFDYDIDSFGISFSAQIMPDGTIYFTPIAKITLIKMTGPAAGMPAGGFSISGRWTSPTVIIKSGMTDDITGTVIIKGNSIKSSDAIGKTFTYEIREITPTNPADNLVCPDPPATCICSTLPCSKSALPPVTTGTMTVKEIKVDPIVVTNLPPYHRDIAQATVTISDGELTLSNMTVTGEWTGLFIGNPPSQSTDESGQTIFNSTTGFWCWQSLYLVCFQVDKVEQVGGSYQWDGIKKKGCIATSPCSTPPSLYVTQMTLTPNTTSTAQDVKVDVQTTKPPYVSQNLIVNGQWWAYCRDTNTEQIIPVTGIIDTSGKTTFLKTAMCPGVQTFEITDITNNAERVYNKAQNVTAYCVGGKDVTLNCSPYKCTNTCEIYDSDLGICVPATTDGLISTALGCKVGDAGCRRCFTGTCTFFISNHHACPACKMCDANGSCLLSSPNSNWATGQYDCGDAGGDQRCYGGVCHDCSNEGGYFGSDNCSGCAGQGGNVCWRVGVGGYNCNQATVCGSYGGCVQANWNLSTSCQPLASYGLCGYCDSNSSTNYPMPGCSYRVSNVQDCNACDFFCWNYRRSRLCVCQF